MNTCTTKKQKSVLAGVENIVGKGGNAVYQHFLLFPQYFEKVFASATLKVKDCVVSGCHCFRHGISLYGMVFKAVFNSISVISQQPVHLSMLSWSSFILSKPLAAVPHNHCPNKRQW